MNDYCGKNFEIFIAKRVQCNERIARLAREGFHDNESKNCYLLMDWIKYNSLSTWIRKKGQDNGDIIRSIIKVIKVIHERGWLHRDTKPENILVENESPLSLLITDFGLSSKISSNPSDKRGAPEVLKMQPQNESADWRSMGHLIYSCYEEYLLQPLKLCLKVILVEIEHKLQMIKDGNEPVINKIIERGYADVLAMDISIDITIDNGQFSIVSIALSIVSIVIDVLQISIKLKWKD
ncbi:2183_t:CDS:2 [Funneliformis caledonium]|uniref:2183_t:CDS:1 n=1 Tax=Funneliformis caledonium TaxID=1117310 RepID=A0A9N9IBM4_9GLOM|nr:2183_t:CDS:2 [Funneliformis caledonium]